MGYGKTLLWSPLCVKTLVLGSKLPECTYTLWTVSEIWRWSMPGKLYGSVDTALRKRRPCKGFALKRGILPVWHPPQPGGRELVTPQKVTTGWHLRLLFFPHPDSFVSEDSTTSPWKIWFHCPLMIVISIRGVKHGFKINWNEIKWKKCLLLRWSVFL